jgi:dipeptidase D
MLKKIIEHFISLTKIPHCSREADRLLEFLESFATERGYSVEIDEAKNLLIKRGEPKLALQAHYDMVCIGDAPNIETYIEDGWMYAKESSLGADNGIAIAMMMVLMDRGDELEFLITSDEEVGLIGASALDFELQSRYMLNLDFEDEAEVCIGCAGGADLLAMGTMDEVPVMEYCYEVSVSGLDGGHSGVDIDRGIPNAIKVLAEYLSDKPIAVSLFAGGERQNSIPASASVILTTSQELKSTDMITVKTSPIDTIKFYNSTKLIELLNSFKHGVHSYNQEFSLPDTSINLAIITAKEGEILIESSARAMSSDGLSEICQKTMTLFDRFGFEHTEQYKYPAWRPKTNEFTKIVNESMRYIFGRSEYKAIHAGLECGLISEKYPNMKFASIGPTICHPHSTREMVKLDSVDKTFEVVEEIVNKIK